MKPEIAIVEPAQVDVDLIAEQVIVAIADHRGAESSAARHEQLGTAARETARMKRIEIGRHLNRVRPTWKERGPNAKGWGEFLARVGLKESTAKLYMDEAKDPEGFAAKHRRSTGVIDPDHEPRHVYLIGCEESRLVKIGSALEIGRRLKEIQLMSPVRLRVIGMILSGGERLERQLHEFFEARRQHGEWFDVTIAEIENAFDRPLVVRQ